jgi:hypothetical protein
MRWMSGIGRATLVVLLLRVGAGGGAEARVLGDPAPGPVPAPQESPHAADYRKCKKCSAALAKAMAYLKANLRSDKPHRIIGSKIGGYMMGGFAFMMEGASAKELEECVKYCKEAIKDTYFNRNWYLGMGLFFLAEYSTRYGLTPDVQKAVAEAYRNAEEQQEQTGGWCHHKEFWKESGYNQKGGGKDLGMVTALVTGAFLELKSLGMNPGPMMERAEKNLETISDGMGIRYGTDNNVGDAAMARASYVLLGLQATGRLTHPLAAKYQKGLESRYREIEKEVHGYSPLHYFSVAAAMHRMGPETYRKFVDEYLDRLIATQTADGVVPLHQEDEVASTAVFACLILMQRDGAFVPRRRTPPGSARSNKEEYRLGQEALARGDLAQAYLHFENVLPDRDSEELVPEARTRVQRISELSWGHFKEAETLESAGETAEAAKAYQAVLKEFSGLPVATEARLRLQALKDPAKAGKKE